MFVLYDGDLWTKIKRSSGRRKNFADGGTFPKDKKSR